MSRSPAWISADVVLTRLCGLCPPIGRVRGLARRQTELLGDEVGRVAVPPREQVDDPHRLRIGDRTQPGVTVASPIAEHISRLGSKASSRSSVCCSVWPTPMITGACGSSAMSGPQ